MEELSLTTPALLFSAVSLILLAYTNRFLSYAQLVRTLKEQHLQHPSKVTRAQIDNLRRRLHLTRTMQLLGVTSLFLCVVTMFLIYVGLMLLSAYVFGAALLLLVGSLGVSIWEIQISVRALEIHLKDMGTRLTSGIRNNCPVVFKPPFFKFKGDLAKRHLLTKTKMPRRRVTASPTNLLM